jgi:hypothetical protein
MNLNQTAICAAITFWNDFLGYMQNIIEICIRKKYDMKIKIALKS